MKFKILSIVPSYPYPIIGGLEKQAHELNSTLVKLGNMVLVLSGKFNDQTKNNEIVDGVRVKRSFFFNNLRTRLLFNAFYSFFYILFKGNKYDIIHIHNLTRIGILCSLGAKLKRIPCIVKIPNVKEKGIYVFKNRYLYYLIFYLFKIPDLFIVLSEDSEKELLYSGVPFQKYFCIVNGINEKKFNIKKNKDMINSIKKSDGLIKILFTGRLVRAKGIKDLLDALKIIIASSKKKNLLLQIVGDGPEKKFLISYAKKLKIEKYVIFLGYQKNVYQFLKNASIFVLPSYHEGNSNSILEAMASGLPVVTTDINASRLQLGKMSLSLMFKPGDSKALAKCLSLLLNSKDLRKRIGVINQRRIKKYFSINDIAKRYCLAYDELLKKKHNSKKKLDASISFEHLISQ